MKAGLIGIAALAAMLAIGMGTERAVADHGDEPLPPLPDVLYVSFDMQRTAPKNYADDGRCDVYMRVHFADAIDPFYNGVRLTGSYNRYSESRTWVGKTRYRVEGGRVVAYSSSETTAHGIRAHRADGYATSTPSSMIVTGPHRTDLGDGSEEGFGRLDIYAYIDGNEYWVLYLVKGERYDPGGTDPNTGDSIRRTYVQMKDNPAFMASIPTMQEYNRAEGRSRYASMPHSSSFRQFGSLRHYLGSPKYTVPTEPGLSRQVHAHTIQERVDECVNDNRESKARLVEAETERAQKAKEAAIALAMAQERLATAEAAEAAAAEEGEVEPDPAVIAAALANARAEFIESDLQARDVHRAIETVMQSREAWNGVFMGSYAQRYAALYSVIEGLSLLTADAPMASVQVNLFEEALARLEAQKAEVDASREYISTVRGQIQALQPIDRYDHEVLAVFLEAVKQRLQ